MIKIRKLDRTAPVYDLTVANTHNFFANDILVHNCTEIMLPTMPFQRINDSGYLQFEHNGKVVQIDNASIASLADGTTKDAYHVTSEDDIVSFLLPTGQVFDLVGLTQLPHTKLTIIKHHKPSIALCTLGSVNWGAFKHPDDMKRACRLLVRALHNLLQYQDFLSIQSKQHNIEFEPLGIGVTNLAYWHAKRKMKYGESDSLAEVKRWIEHQTFYITQASVELAKEKGPCTMSHTTLYGKGIFPWEKRAIGVNDLTDFTPSPDLDWEHLRQDMITYGIRNSTLSAIAPVESCQSLGNKLMLTDGTSKSLSDLITLAGIDIDDIHTCNIQQWVNLPIPFQLQSDSGIENVTKVWYNGVSETKRITFEDGNTYEFTLNHRLKIIRNGQDIWEYVGNLQEGDDVKTFS